MIEEGDLRRERGGEDGGVGWSGGGEERTSKCSIGI